MEIDLSDKGLTPDEKAALEGLLRWQGRGLQTDLEQMWYLIDRVWDDLGCNNRDLDPVRLENFYSHPIWLLNGLFTEQDEESLKHRHAISDWIVGNDFLKVADYGGGFGTLARLIAQKGNGVHIDILEPHPSECGLKRTREFPNIAMVERLGGDYDCLISTDVLEHVPDPLEDLSAMIGSVKTGGSLMIANAFFPVIKCHLPRCFHFRYTFNCFAHMMGLRNMGPLEGCHGTVFEKVDCRRQNWNKLRFYEKVSRILFPVLETAKPVAQPVKRLGQAILQPQSRRAGS